ncbi:hypothetical protein [Paractinoplanes hotanensis]|uniref:hypothetical protein n=1 Tax=Paractinoplanes hotanensis TaxID=2906497 RepID=UPI002043010A|nr:hypothetical protein [Actinoplanes hotanensis]
MEDQADLDLRGARGVIIGDHGTMHLHLHHGRPSWWTRSGYLDQVRDIAPGHGVPGALLDREQVLAELAAFCAGEDSYLWWMAGPWAGKSALLSTFVLQPPPKVEIVSFFITARLADQSDSTAFTDMLIDQLSAIMGESVPGSLTPAAANTYRRALLSAAAKKVRDEGRRLVLVVDGLDEDIGGRPGSKIASVASLLPAVSEHGLKVVVSSRPHPELPQDVPSDHPLRVNCRIRQLDPSTHAGEVAERANGELLELLSGDKLQRQTLGLITASGGGLTVRELEHLTGKPPYALEQMLGGVFGRTVVGRADADQGRLYLFAHETLRETAVRGLGKHIETYRRKIHGWADGYRPKWPADTPQYLLRGYVRMLTDQRDTDRLTALAVDAVRHDRMLSLSGGDVAALAEIRACQNLILADDDLTETGLFRLLRLSHHRDQLESRNSNTPADLPAVWAAVGQPTRAEALARSITDPARQEQALAGLAGAIAVAGDIRRGAQVAAGIDDTSLRKVTLDNLARVAGAAGDLELATEIAVTVGDQRLQLRTLTDLSRAAAAGGDLRLGRQIAENIVSTPARAAALAKLATNAASIGDPARTAALADAAAEAAATLAEASKAVEVLAEIVRAVGRIGDRNRATEFTEQAKEFTRTVRNDFERGALLAALALATAAAGDRSHAGQIAGDITDQKLRAQTLADLNGAADQTDDSGRRPTSSECARMLADGITDQRLKAVAHAGLGRHGASAGLTARPSPGLTGPRHTLDEAVAAVLRPVRTLADAAVRVAECVADPARHPDLVRQGQRLTKLADDTDRRHAMSLSDGARLAADGAGGASRQPLENLVRALLGSDLLHQVTELAEIAEHVAGDIAMAHSQGKPLSELEPEIQALRGQADTVLATASVWRRTDVVIVAGLTAAAIADPFRRVRTLTDTAHALAVDGDLTSARRLAEFADMGVGVITELTQRTRALSELARVFADVGDLPRSVEFAERIPDWQSRENALAGLASRGASADDVETAVRAARAMKDSSRQTQTLAAVAREAGTTGHHERAFRIAKGIADPSQQAHVLTDLARTAAAAGDMERAVQLADAAERTARSIVDQSRAAEALTELARVTASAGDAQQAMELVEAAEQTARGIVDSARQATALAEAARAMAQVTDIQRAVRAARTITQHSEQASALTELARSAAAAGDREFAERIVLEITDPFRRAEALATLAGSAAAEGDMQAAIHAADLIVDPTRRAATLTDLVGIGAAAGDARQSAALADATAVFANTVPDPYQRAQILSGLAGAVAGGGELTRAVAIAESIPSPSRQVQTLVDLAHFEAAAGEPERALPIALAIPDPRLQSQTLIDLIRLVAASGSLDRARQIAHEINDDALRAQTFAELAAACRRSTTVTDPAEQMAHQISNRQLQKRAMANLAGRAATAGDMARAFRIAWRITDSRSRGLALAKLARALADRGDMEEAVKVAALIEDKFRQSVEVAGLARRATESGHLPRAAEIAAKIQDPAVQAQELMMLASRLADADDIPKAVLVALDITAADQRARMLANLAARAAATGQVDEALHIARRIIAPSLRAPALIELSATRPEFAEAAENATAQITIPSQKALCLARLAGQAAARRPEKAKALADAARQVAKGITDVPVQAQTLVEMAQVPAMPGSLRLIGEALVMTSWRISLPSLANAYPHVLRKFTTTDLQ